QRKSELKHLVELAVNAVQPVRDQQRAGLLSLEQASTVGRAFIQRLSFSEGESSNYLFMGSYNGETPTLSSGQPLGAARWDQADAAGRNIVTDLVRAAQSPTGAGYVEYLVPQPAGAAPQKKIAYVIGIPEWQSYIGTAMNMGDIETENQTFLRNSLLLMSGLFLFVFFVIYVALRPVLSSYLTLLRLFDRVSRNPDTLPPVPINQFRAGTEGWQLISGFQAMLQRVQNSRQLIRSREEQYRSIFENTTDGMIITSMDGVILVEANPACCAMHGYTHEEFMRLSAPQFVAPESWPQIDEFVRAVGAGKDFRSQIVVQRKDGTHRDVEVRGTVITYQDKPHMLGVLRDITERVQAYRTLEQRVQERTRELTALLEVSHNVASTLELQPLLSMILDQLKSLVDYNGAAIFVREGGRIVNVDYRGPAPLEDVLKIDMSKRSTIEAVLQERAPMIIDDVRADTPQARTFAASAGELMDTTFGYIRSWMGVPLMTKEWVIGVLCMDHSMPGYYTAQHAQLALAIANQAAVAIENARLYEQAQQLAVLEERQRLARELHDSVSQALYGIALGARTARTLLERDPAQVVEPLNYVLSLAEAGLAEMRALIFELRPESLETEGLVAALGKQASSVQARHGLVIDTEFCDEPKLSFEVKEAFYRIAQEALNNTVKHARARRVALRLLCGDGSMMLQVQDDGLGFDPAAAYPGHLGLKSMRERITRIGGTLNVVSESGKGTCVQAQVKV
ncbi:MAG TPA: cache domain-containing protein, partial [Anaerolineae bacterium]